MAFRHVPRRDQFAAIDHNNSGELGDSVHLGDSVRSADSGQLTNSGTIFTFGSPTFRNESESESEHDQRQNESEPASSVKKSWLQRAMRGPHQTDTNTKNSDSRPKPKLKKIYIILICIFLSAIIVIVVFLYMGSENLDDSIAKAEKQVKAAETKINSLRNTIQQDIANLEARHHTASNDLLNLDNAHKTAKSDLTEYTKAGQSVDQKQNLLATTLNRIATAAQALGNSLGNSTAK